MEYKQLKVLRKKGLRYWLRAAVVVVLGVWFGAWLSASDCWLEQRRATYRWLHSLNPRKPQPKWVSLVLIEDDEHWLGEPAGRKPTNRDYLAKLMRAVAAANPALVALDFSLRSPSPDGNPIDHANYEKETEALMAAIREIGKECPVVIPKTLGPEGKDGYTTESDIYDRSDFKGATVLKGYIGLPYDERLVPAVPLPLESGCRLDSFAGAIVRAIHPQMLSGAKDHGTTTLPYGDFMNLEEFTRVSAGDILRNEPSARAALKHRLVLIGAHWHEHAMGRWRLVDLHGSPNGDMSGVVLHANYVEAILDSRIHPGWKPFALHIVEGLGAVLVILIFAFEIRPMFKALAVAGVVSMLLMVSAISLLFFGLVFDFFVPVAAAVAHGLFEQVLEWRDAARASHPQASL